MLAIKCTTRMGEVPPLREFARYGAPFFNSGGTLHHLILILIDDDLAHFWDEQGYGIVRDPPPIGHLVILGPSGEMLQSEGKFQTRVEGLSVVCILLGDPRTHSG